MTSNIRNTEALLAHATTIGHDFDVHGGDIPMAIALSYYLAVHQPKGHDKHLAMYFSKIVSAQALAERLAPVSTAAWALHEELGDDWLFLALAAHYGETRGEAAARAQAESVMDKAAEALADLEDDPWRAVRLLGKMAIAKISGAWRPKTLAA